MNAAKTGFIAKFKTAYLQREIRVEATVVGGTDVGLRDADIGTAAIAQLAATRKGYAPGRLVVYNNGAITAPENVTATSIGTATHIIAQSDDTIRDLPEDYNYTEQYSTLPNLICKNTGTTGAAGEKKTVALYKIVNKDDIEIVNLG